jgi:hypothetical protein
MRPTYRDLKSTFCGAYVLMRHRNVMFLCHMRHIMSTLKLKHQFSFHARVIPLLPRGFTAFAAPHRIHRATSHSPCLLVFPHRVFPAPPRLHRTPPHLLRARYLSPPCAPLRPLHFAAATSSPPRARSTLATPLQRCLTSSPCRLTSSLTPRRPKSTPPMPCHLAAATTSAR